MLSFAIAFVAAIVGLVVLDRLVMWVLPMIAPLLPNEFCGPDGWLMDTQQASGIFDRPTR
jgi:hypothetical protein